MTPWTTPPITLCPISLSIDPVVGSPLPVSLDLIKLHCAVDGIDQDELLETYLFAAIHAFEGTTHRTLFQRQHRWVLASFPFPCSTNLNQSIWLPRGRAVSVDHIDYVSGGITTTLRGPTSIPVGTDYQEALFDGAGLILPIAGQSWPSTDCNVPEPVKITFTAGWQSNELPSDVLTALLFHIRMSLDDNRTDPQKTQANLDAFEALVSGYRLSRSY